MPGVMAFLDWLVGFGLTLAVEGPIYLWGAYASGWVSGRGQPGWRRVLLVVVGINLVTHPVLWVVSRSWTGVADLLLGELVVVLVEGTLLAPLLRGRRWAADLGWTLLLALAANAASVLVGLLVLP